MDFKNFHWINEGDAVIEEGRITLTAPALTDFFCGGGQVRREFCRNPCAMHRIITLKSKATLYLR